MQSHDFVFYLFVLIAALFGVLALYARRKALAQRALHEESQKAAEPAPASLDRDGGKRGSAS